MLLPFPFHCSSMCPLSSMVLPFPFLIHPFLPSLPWFFLSLFIVHLFLPSLPWFFLSLFILQAFLLWSPALAVQALPLAHNVEWCLRASTASPSLHPQSGAQVGFLKMSAEGVGSRVIRATKTLDSGHPFFLKTSVSSRRELHVWSCKLKNSVSSRWEATFFEK